MPHPIYGPPQHKLEVVTLKLRLPTRALPSTYTAELVGESSGKRAPLWSAREVWSGEEYSGCLPVIDWAHHGLLAALQDAPASHDALERALRGGVSQEASLPF